MSFFTPHSAAYIKTSIAKIRHLAFQEGYAMATGDEIGAADYRTKCDAEQARLVAYADGCTLEKGKGDGRAV